MYHWKTKYMTLRQLKIIGLCLLLGACASPQQRPTPQEDLIEQTEIPQKTRDEKLIDATKNAPIQLKTTIFQLLSSSPFQQIKAIRALRNQLPESEIATPLLIDFLGNHKSIAMHVTPFDKPNENLTTLSLEALETLIAIGDYAVPELLTKLASPQADIRKHAAYALGEIGNAEALEPLEKLKREPNPQVRAIIQSAIKKIRSNYLGSAEQVGL